jgi:hypothetical protein
MVHRQQNHVVLLAKFEQSDSNQRSVRKVEGALPLLLRQAACFTLANFFSQETKIDYR